MPFLDICSERTGGSAVIMAVFEQLWSGRLVLAGCKVWPLRALTHTHGVTDAGKFVLVGMRMPVFLGLKG